MSENTQEASIKASIVETTEPTFKLPLLVNIPKTEPLPQAGTTVDTGEAVKTIFATLEPEEKDETTYWSPGYLDFYKTVTPPYIPTFPKMPEYEEPTGDLVINIETTGTRPWESRLICIGVLDPNMLAPEAINFITESEEQTLNEFMEWLAGTNYTTLVGFNVSFDYRFLYALMQKYRKNSPQWKEMKLYDLMQQQKQVKDSYVFGYNPTGTLEEWSTYLFGANPYAPQKQVFKWWKEKNVEEIVNFNSDKLIKAYYLWVLDKVVSGTIPGAEVMARPGTTEETAPGETPSGFPASAAETISVQCSKCMQVQDMPKEAKVVYCKVCGTPIANPAL